MTIKDIAKLANVSEGTVDRVIHNRNGVSDKTAKKIKKILEEHNFKLNPIASALASKKNYLIACLIPKHNNQNEFWKSPYLGILKGKEEVKNYGVQVKTYFFDQFEPDTYLSAFTKILNDGPNVVLMVPIFNKETEEITHKLDAKNIPYMFINVDGNNFNNISFIGQDSHIAGYVAAKLISLSIPQNSTCCIVQTRASITDHNAIANRIKGFKDYIKEHNIKINTQILKIDLDKTKDEKKKIKAFFEAHPDIKGVFVPSSRVSTIAKLIYKYYKKAPLTFLGYDTTDENIDYLKKDKVQFLISQRSFNQGYEAVRMMFDFLVHKKIPEQKIYSPIQIILKENVDFDSRYKKSFKEEYETSSK